MTLRRERIVVALLCVVFIVKGALWALALPLWQGPDEDDHYAVIQFIAETGRLPDVGDERLPDEVDLSREIADVGRLDYDPEARQAFGPDPVGPREAEFATLSADLRASFDRDKVGKLMHATPLYYVLATPVYQLTAGGDLLQRAFAQRLLAVFLTMPIVLAAYAIGRHLFPGDPALRLTIPFLVAFHPMVTQIGAIVSVDGLFFVLYSLLIWLCLLIWRDGLTWRYAILTGLIFATALLVKPTINGLAPVIAVIGLIELWRRRDRWRTVIARGATMVLLILLPVGWWMQRSLRLNDDLFYFNPVDKGHRLLQNPVYDYAFLQHALDYWRSVWGGIFVTWWAHFGWIDTPLRPWSYDLLRGLTVAAIAGLCLAAWRQWRAQPGRAFLRRIAPYLILAAAIATPALLLQYYDLSFWRTYGNGRGLQGRYWLGTVIPMLTLWSAGLLVWLPARLRPLGHWALRAGMVLLNLVSLLGFVLPRYYL